MLRNSYFNFCYFYLFIFPFFTTRMITNRKQHKKKESVKRNQKRFFIFKKSWKNIR